MKLHIFITMYVIFDTVLYLGIIYRFVLYLKKSQPRERNCSIVRHLGRKHIIMISMFSFNYRLQITRILSIQNINYLSDLNYLHII